MLDVDLVFQQRFANAGASSGGDLGALGAQLCMGKNLDDRHGLAS
jgi:hypothetical protein